MIITRHLIDSCKAISHSAHAWTCYYMMQSSFLSDEKEVKTSSAAPSHSQGSRGVWKYVNNKLCRIIFLSQWGCSFSLLHFHLTLSHGEVKVSSRKGREGVPLCLSSVCVFGKLIQHECMGVNLEQEPGFHLWSHSVIYATLGTAEITHLYNFMA